MGLHLHLEGKKGGKGKGKDKEIYREENTSVFQDITEKGSLARKTRGKGGGKNKERYAVVHWMKRETNQRISRSEGQGLKINRLRRRGKGGNQPGEPQGVIRTGTGGVLSLLFKI